MGKQFGSALDIPVLTADPASPAAGFVSVYCKGGNVFQRDSAGTVSQLTNTIISGSLLPIGVMVPFATTMGQGVPTGWLECDGAILNQTNYPQLASVLTDTFNRSGETYPSVCRLPDAASRFIRGRASNVSVGANEGLVTDPTVRAVRHQHTITTLSTANAGQHQHTAGGLINSATGHQFTNNTTTGGTAARLTQIAGMAVDGNHNHNISGNVGNADALHAHNVIGGPVDLSAQSDFPWLTTRYIILALA